MPAHNPTTCPSCVAHPDAYRLGYATVAEGMDPATVTETDQPAEDDQASQWWLAYYHGRADAR